MTDDQEWLTAGFMQTLTDLLMDFYMRDLHPIIKHVD